MVEDRNDISSLFLCVSIQEIRSRHWMKVMRLTGSSFQLEANVFQLAHVLDIELIKYDINPTPLSQSYLNRVSGFLCLYICICNNVIIIVTKVTV